MKSITAPLLLGALVATVQLVHGYSVNTSRAPRTAVGECPAKDPATPIYLPDSERCDIFYECSGGIPFQNNCPAGLEFNPLLKVCDWPLGAGCTATHGVKHISTYSAIGECPPKDGATPVYLPDSESCSKYYECSNGEPIHIFCPPGLLFNPKINVCDWEFNVDCNL